MEKRKEEWFVCGDISETVDFSEISDSDGPLTLNLIELGDINSIGCLSLLRFVNGLGERKIEFHNCPTSFLDLINMIPTMLGPAQDPSILKSIQIPYFCSEHKVVKLFVKSNDLTIKDKEVAAPDRDCPECSKKMTIDEDVEMFLQIMAS